MLGTELVFAYGSNMDHAQMQERCPSSKQSEPFIAQAKGWRLCFPRRSTKRNGGVGSIVRSETGTVWGVVFSVTPEDLTILDKREGVRAWPPKYHRELVEIQRTDGRTLDVWTYFAVPDDSPAREYIPSRAYIELYIKGAEHYNIPGEYIEQLRQIRTDERQL